MVRRDIELYSNELIQEEQRGVLLEAKSELTVVGVEADLLADLLPNLEAAAKRGVATRVVIDPTLLTRGPVHALVERLRQAGVTVDQRKDMGAALICHEHVALLLGSARVRAGRPSLAIRLERTGSVGTVVDRFLKDTFDAA